MKKSKEKGGNSNKPQQMLIKNSLFYNARNIPHYSIYQGIGSQ